MASEPLLDVSEPDTAADAGPLVEETAEKPSDGDILSMLQQLIRIRYGLHNDGDDALAVLAQCILAAMPAPTPAGQVVIWRALRAGGQRAVDATPADVAELIAKEDAAAKEATQLPVEEPVEEPAL